MVIDCHTHVWPDDIAARALGPAVPDLPRQGDGRVTTLLQSMAEAGIDRSVCLGVADGAQRVDGTNRFASQLDAVRLIGFGSIHPELEPGPLVGSLRAAGLRGVKIHPLFQHYSLDDPRLGAILDALGDEFVAIVHFGPAGGTPVAEHHFCSPDKVGYLVREFPRLKLVACHFGGFRMLTEAEEMVIGLPVHLDTAWPPSLATLDRQRVRRLVERHGPDRVVFGSDWPVASQLAEIAAIEALRLSTADTDAILGGNMARLLGLEGERTVPSAGRGR
jgi:predicted TIM-barrel fold metal-dependent hydrolase